MIKTNTVLVPVFDYSQLDKDITSKLQYYVNSGRALVRRNQIRFIAEFGKMLSESRKLLANHGDGTFCKWATSEFDLSRKTVYNYVNAWERCLCNGYTNYDHVSPAALYLLSRDDTPKPVRDKALQLAKKQPVLTKSDVEALLDRGGSASGAKPKPAPQLPPPSDPFDDIDNKGEDADSEWTPEEPSSRPPRNGKDKPAADYGKCPNCAGTKWDKDEEGYVSCRKCRHPHGEPVGDVDEDRLTTQRQKTAKTLEAAMRAFDDLQTMRAKAEHKEAIASCKRLLQIAKGWK